MPRKGACGIIGGMEKQAQEQKAGCKGRLNAPTANWLVLDEGLKPEWEREASRGVSEICGEAVSVEIGLPTLKAAQSAYKKNENLRGTISWSDEAGNECGISVPMPFHGVFVLNNPGGRLAQVAVWNSYLETLPKEMPSEDKDKIRDDLTKRFLRTFPRQLLKLLCKRMEEARSRGAVFNEDYWRADLVYAQTWLTSGTALLRRATPNNAADLMSQIAGVRRYVVSRKGAMGYAADKRMNHRTFDGRICPVDTPESEMVGLSLQLARGAWVDKDGIIHPAESTDAIDRISWGTALIPFAHNNDGARDMMGAKNLRQATPVLGRGEPAVKTGAERALADSLAPLMEAGICPESRDKGKTCIAMGRDLLVAYLPWNGWNLDDALVVSESIVRDMSVVERKTFSRPVEARFQLKALAKPGKIACGGVIARFCDPKGKAYEVRYNDEKPAKIVSIKCGDGTEPAGDGVVMQTLTYELEKEIPLGLGDKLMARHGNKGVVGRVLPESEMPRLPDDKRLPEKMRGKTIEILVNPHGVLSRMNPGQLLETHLGWLFRAGGFGEDDVRSKGRVGSIGAPEVGMLDYGKVQELLEKTGLDRNGKIKLVLPPGGQTLNPVVVGYEHFVRLHHIPELKAQARAGGAGESYNSVTLQPAHGRKVGGGQRLGEMEVWALCAHGADHVLEEMLGAKSDRDWSADGEPSGKDAEGNDKYGFTHLLHDWLRALCIDFTIDREKNEARFAFLSDAEKLKAEIGADRRVVSDKTCEEVKTGSFSCQENTCGWSLPGTYALLGGQSLKFGALLKELGYDGTGPLQVDDRGHYSVRLIKKKKPVGELAVELDDFSSESTTLNLTVSPSKGRVPSGWPKDKAFKKICLRAKPMAREVELAKFGLKRPSKKQRPLPAGYLLVELKDGESERSIWNDFSVVCPHHRTEKLKMRSLVDVETDHAEGGLFDPDIFKGKDDWGFIELPESIDYPYWTAVGETSGKGRRETKRELKAVEGVKITVIPVLPLHYRKPKDKDALFIDKDDISHHYQRIVSLCGRYRKADGDKAKRTRRETVNMLKQAVADLFGELAKRLEKKPGLLRHEGLGRRVDRSFRLVITPNPKLLWDQAGIPTSVLWEILGDQVETDEAHRCTEAESGPRVIERKAGWTWHKKLLPRDAHKRMKAFLDKHRDLVVLLNRQPSLHRDSIQAFHPVAIPPEAGEVLQLSPLCCEGFAADFDGDEMTGHYPVSAEAQEDARKMLPGNNLRSIATGACLAHLDRDLVTGLELIHRDPDRYLKKITEAFRNDGVEFGKDATDLMCDKSLEAGEFGKKVFAFWCEHCPDVAVKKISALSRVAFRACTDEGVSFGFFDLRDAMIEPDKKDAGEWRVVGDESPFAVMVNSGANGAKQIKQVVKERGELESVEGKIRESLVGGMPWKTFFAAAQNARSSMCQKKIGTQKAGYLTRQLVLGLWGWKIAEKDCGCGDGGRSVLACTCQKNNGRGICAKCFGKLPNGKEPEVGMPVGLIAAQSLGERGTQLSMRVFHTGGHEIDFDKVAKLMRRATVVKEGGKEVVVKDYKGFIAHFAKGAYAKIDKRYFQLLWRALKSAPKQTLSSIDADPFAKLATGSQMEEIRQYAEENVACSLDSPFARVFFNLFGDRQTGVGDEVHGEEDE